MPTATTERLEQRLTDIEIKSTFTEDLLDHLNAQVIAQQRQLDLLLREITLLRQQQTDSQPTALRSLRDELPPHY
jgi:SlyX protein